MKVNFLIVGAQKSGTTALSKFLSYHPQICNSPKKELSYFNNDANFSSHPPSYNNYHAAFSNYSGQKAVGEATPYYMFEPVFAKRIRDYNPFMKLIFILRNPIERAYSQYCMNILRKEVNLPFYFYFRFEGLLVWLFKKIKPLQHKIIKNRNYYYKNVTSYNLILRNYVSRGYYSRHIKNMLTYFPREQMVFICTEDLKERHNEMLFQIYDFLEVDRATPPKSEEVFTFKEHFPPMRSRDKQYLLKKYESEFKDLEELLDWDLTKWRNR